MDPRTNDQTVYDCNFCEKVYTIKQSLQSHLRTKHNKKVVENTKKTEAIVASITIMNEIVENAVDTELQRKQINPNEEWLTNTNTDLSDMLDRIENDILENPMKSEHNDVDMINEETPDLEELDCAQCGETLDLNESMNDHMKNVHSIVDDQLSPDNCNICGDKFNDDNGLSDHINNQHINENPPNNDSTIDTNECKQCHNYKQVEGFMDKALKKKQECIEKMGASLKKMAKEKKSLIGENKSLRKIINENKKENHVKKVYLCDVCTFETESKDQLKNHIHCLQCGTYYKTMLELNSHIHKTHVNQILTECDSGECKKMSKTMKEEIKQLKESLDTNAKIMEETLDQLHNNNSDGSANKTDHIKGNLKDMKVELDKCRKELAQKEKRVGILMVEVTLKDDTIEAMKKQMAPSDSNHVGSSTKCSVCGVECRNKSKLKTHIDKYHSFKCNKCDAKFETKESLSNHSKHNHKDNTDENKTVKYICNNCEKTFSTNNNLSDHLTQPKHQEFKCNTCGKQMQTKGDLINHMKKNHGQPPVIMLDESVVYKCNVCSNTYESKNDWRDHLSGTVCPYKPPNPLEQSGRINNNTNDTIRPSNNQIPECRNGLSCKYLRNNRCNFYHAISEQPYTSDNGRQWEQVNYHRRNQRNSDRQSRVSSHASSGGVRWCRYGDTCNKGRVCQFRHYDLDFPPLRVLSRQ